MNCFEYPYIGLHGICEEPESGVYLNGISGIEFARFSTLANGEDLNGKNLFKKLHNEAVAQLKSDFLCELRECVEFKDIVTTKVYGNFGRNFQYYAGKIGKLIQKNDTDGFTKPRIDWIKFYSDSKQDKYLYIEECGDVVIKKPIKVKKGLNHIRVNYNVNNLEALIYIEGCNIGIGEGSNCGCGGVCDSCCCYNDKCVDVESLCIMGDEWTRQQNGFTVKVSCIACYDDLICENESILTTALRYGIVLQLAQHVIQSNDIHPLVRNGKEDALRWQVWFGGGKDPVSDKEYDSKYMKEIKNAVQGIKESILSLNSQSIECKGLRIMESKP